MKYMNFIMLMICEICGHTYKLIGIKKKFGFCKHDCNIRKNLFILYNNAFRILLKSNKMRLFIQIFSAIS